MGRKKTPSPKLTSIREFIEVERLVTSTKFIPFVNIPGSSGSGLNVLPLEKLQKRAVRRVQNTKRFLAQLPRVGWYFFLPRKELSGNMPEIHKMSGILKKWKGKHTSFLKIIFQIKKKKWHQVMLSELESTIGNNSSYSVLSQWNYLMLLWKPEVNKH